MQSEYDDGEKSYDRWAHYFFSSQQSETGKFKLTVYRKGARVTEAELTSTPDRTWPRAERGLYLSPDLRHQTASGLVDAVWMGGNKTWRVASSIYLMLSSLASRRVDTTQVGGPIAIATTAFGAADDIPVFILLLGALSINLAVVNFLPIPILDGGHMVFLIYEGIVGKPPPENVRAVATYIGLAIILFLMVFVFYNDLDRLFGWFRWGR
jgi:regulator of sigma E protease